MTDETTCQQTQPFHPLAMFIFTWNLWKQTVRGLKSVTSENEDVRKAMKTEMMQENIGHETLIKLSQDVQLSYKSPTNEGCHLKRKETLDVVGWLKSIP